MESLIPPVYLLRIFIFFYDRFVSIDTDSDGRISVDETIQWYAKAQGVEKVSAQVLRAVYAEFQKMDANKDMFIGPNEFDSSL